jgi:limonene-1,2-epoxide hydrolase
MSSTRDLTHVRAFAAALQAKDRDAMLAQMADGIVLNTPLAAEPVRGKAAIRPVVDALLATIDAFEIREILEGPTYAAAYFGASAGPHRLDGTDVWRLDAAGLIAEMTVLWRPLPEALAVRDRLARAAESGTMPPDR